MIHRWPALFVRPQFRFRRDIQLAAVLLYAAIGLSFVAPYLSSPNVAVADQAGVIWHVRSVRAASVVIMMSSMGVTVALALLRLAITRRPAGT